MRSGRERETVVVRGASCKSKFDVDKTKQTRWFSFKGEIVSNRYDFVLYASATQEPTRHKSQQFKVLP